MVVERRLKMIQKLILLLGFFLGIDCFALSITTGKPKYFVLTMVLICIHGIALISTYIIVHYTILGGLLALAIWLFLVFKVRNLAGARNIRGV